MQSSTRQATPAVQNFHTVHGSVANASHLLSGGVAYPVVVVVGLLLPPLLLLLPLLPGMMYPAKPHAIPEQLLDRLCPRSGLLCDSALVQHLWMWWPCQHCWCWLETLVQVGGIHAAEP
jgi:hypothetical protein